MTRSDDRTGHRARLRRRFLADPKSVPDPQLLELLLMYAIPRRDVAPLAQSLLDRYGNIEAVLDASYNDLVAISGIGEQAATLIKLLAQLVNHTPSSVGRPPDMSELIVRPVAQRSLFPGEEPSLGPLFDEPSEPTAPAMRTFANDEIANALTFVPEAARFETYVEFQAHLEERLPYNSLSTRKRRASYILNRFFPVERLDVPLAYYAANCSSQRDLKAALFYHVLKAEPVAAKVAEDFIWPAVPLGRTDRESMREFVLRYLPDIGPASQKKVLTALFNTYDLLSVGRQDDTFLRFQIQTGTLEGFLYVLTSELPRAGIYTFEVLDEGPMRYWLLWDREWMHQQLYNLRDFGILSKVSQIDTIRQFTLQFDQRAALHHYFEHPQRDTLALREGPDANGNGR